MVTHELCPFYDKCGFVKWRKEGPDKHIKPLSENGDCGKNNPSLCGRVNDMVPIEPTKYGPQTREEMDIAFPPLPNNNGRPERRLTGGGFKD